MRLTLKRGWDVVAEGELKIDTGFMTKKDKVETGDGEVKEVNRNQAVQGMMFDVERAINASSPLRAHLELIG
jgi:hypothetical protein